MVRIKSTPKRRDHEIISKIRPLINKYVDDLYDEACCVALFRNKGMSSSDIVVTRRDVAMARRMLKM